jgi:hypothetical protein
MKTSPTQRSLKHLRADGWTCCIVEKWIAQIKQRKDAFGFGDLLCVRVGSNGAMLVQATTGDHFSHRLEKIKTIPEAAIWLAAGNTIRLMTWAKQGARGKRKTWTLREMDVTANSLRVLDPISP